MFTITALYTDASTRTVHMTYIAYGDDGWQKAERAATAKFNGLCEAPDCVACIMVNGDGQEAERYNAQ